MSIKQIRQPRHVATIRTQPRRKTPYNDVRWVRASKAWLEQYPLCVLCLARGHINQRAMTDGVQTQRTLVVDHIEPHRGEPNLFWDQTNWQTLCRLCHDIDKSRHERSGGNGRQWLAYLRAEIARTSSHDVWSQAIPHLPGGVWGSDAKT